MKTKIENALQRLPSWLALTLAVAFWFGEVVVVSLLFGYVHWTAGIAGLFGMAWIGRWCIGDNDKCPQCNVHALHLDMMGSCLYGCINCGWREGDPIGKKETPQP